MIQYKLTIWCLIDVTYFQFDFLFAFDSTSWFRNWKYRIYGPDRTVVALAPSGNAIINSIKSTIEADLGSKGVIVKLYSSRDEIMNVMSSSTYEKDGAPGIWFGAAFTEASSSGYTINMIFDDMPSNRSFDSNMPNQRNGPYNTK